MKYRPKVSILSNGKGTSLIAEKIILGMPTFQSGKSITTVSTFKFQRGSLGLGFSHATFIAVNVFIRCEFFYSSRS